MHVLARCRGMEEVWSGAPFFLTGNHDSGSFWAWLMALRNTLSEAHFLLAVTVMWKSWEVRNLDVHNSPIHSPPDIVAWSREFLDAFQAAQVLAPGSTNGAANEVWIPPPRGVLKINVDAGFPGQQDDCWISMVARDSAGECVWWSRRRLVGRPKPADAEVIKFITDWS